MNFCDKCHNLLYPYEENNELFLRCSCGFKKKHDNKVVFSISYKKNSGNSAINTVSNKYQSIQKPANDWWNDWPAFFALFSQFDLYSDEFKIEGTYLGGDIEDRAYYLGATITAIAKYPSTILCPAGNGPVRILRWLEGETIVIKCAFIACSQYINESWGVELYGIGIIARGFWSF